jgi:hypothetical protein
MAMVWKRKGRRMKTEMMRKRERRGMATRL